METKKCRNCGIEKDMSEYYKHKDMWDGHLNKCKDCVKTRVGEHRAINIDKIREYDRNRPNAKERSAMQIEKRKNMTQEEKAEYYNKKRKYNNSGHGHNKKVVNMYTQNAVRDGRLEKSSKCEHCGDGDSQLDGHHHSYLEPLNVTWLCKPCHGAEHKRINKERRKNEI